ncbi:MAG: hypothetical protein KDH20_09660 [Rhodocyclaceae bacterium]|nr:hypothetical protein [Rhodocyclaceae bacterium]
MASVLELAKLSAAVYKNSQACEEWLRIGLPYREEGSGFCSAIYHKGKVGEYALVIAGTDPTEVDDLRSDAQLFLGRMPDQYRVARTAYALAAQFVDPDATYLTGHSLGGGLASMLGKEHGDPVVTFNAPGMARAFADVQRREGGLSAASDETRKVLHVCAVMDVVSRGTGAHMGAGGKVERIRSIGARDVLFAVGAGAVGGLIGSVAGPAGTGAGIAAGAGGAIALRAHSIDRLVAAVAGHGKYCEDLGWV